MGQRVGNRGVRHSPALKQLESLQWRWLQLGRAVLSQAMTKTAVPAARPGAQQEPEMVSGVTTSRAGRHTRPSLQGWTKASLSPQFLLWRASSPFYPCDTKHAAYSWQDAHDTRAGIAPENPGLQPEHHGYLPFARPQCLRLWVFTVPSRN